MVQIAGKGWLRMIPKALCRNMHLLVFVVEQNGWRGRLRRKNELCEPRECFFLWKVSIGTDSCAEYLVYSSNITSALERLPSISLFIFGSRLNRGRFKVCFAIVAFWYPLSTTPLLRIDFTRLCYDKGPR